MNTITQKDLASQLAFESSEAMSLGFFGSSRGKSLLSSIRDQLPEWLEEKLLSHLQVDPTRYYLKGLISERGVLAFRPMPKSKEIEKVDSKCVVFGGTLHFVPENMHESVELVGEPDRPFAEILGSWGVIRVTCVAFDGLHYTRELAFHPTTPVAKPTARPAKAAKAAA